MKNKIDMKTNNFFRLKSAGTLLLALFFSAWLFPSCEEEQVSDPYFSIEGNPTGLTVPKAGITHSFTVRSNRPWQLIAQSEGDWVKIFPSEGDDDGIFKIIVSENASFDARTMDYAIIVGGEEQPVLFRVDQQPNVPYITVPATVTIPSAGGDVTINVTSNVSWTYSISGASWLTQKSVTATQIVLTSAQNTSIDPRSATMTLTTTGYAVSVNVTLTQSPGTVVLEENFNWLNYGNVVFYTTTGETIISSWTQAEKDKGWTSSINTTSGSGNTPLCYARVGFVKLGKTGYGGDLISPKLTKLTGTQNLTVTFKAIPYMTAAGTKDDNILKVSVVGPGTVSQSQFTIGNWPVYPTSGADTYCIALWNDPAATRTFTVTGATSDTQIKFLGYDYYLVGVGAGKNRIFLDDIKVEIVP
ncbi:MAG: BACON domain-containing protein [Bacteroidia bacterium]|nr:BACON domain-containing protein [Bacteroidia bacterium]